MTRAYDADYETSVVLLGTTYSPGVVKLEGHDRKKNWDIKAAKGTTGASTSLNGDTPLSFTATFYLVDDAADGDTSESNDFDDWEAFQRLIESTTSGPKPFALPIYHPDLARNKITEVTNGGIGGFVHDGKGGATVKVTFQEYRPAKAKKSASPTAKGAGAGSGTSKGKAAPFDPNAAAKAELAGLVAEARKP